VYCTDPNGILVEWCADTVPSSEADRVEALRVLRDPKPELEEPPVPVFHMACDHRAADDASPRTREPVAVDAG